MKKNPLTSTRSASVEDVSSSDYKSGQQNVLLEAEFWSFALAVLFATGAYITTYFYIPKLCQDLHGFTKKQSQLLLSILGVFNFVGRIAVGWISDKFPESPILSYGLSCLGCGLCTLSITMVEDQWVVSSVVAVFGLFSGSLVCSVGLCALEMFGISRVNFVTGLFYSFFGVSVYTILPAAGMLFDKINKDYVVPMMFLSLCNTIAMIFTVITFFVQQRKDIILIKHP